MTNETSSDYAGGTTTGPSKGKTSSNASSKSSVTDFSMIVRSMEKGDMTPKEISDGRARISAEAARLRWRYGKLAAQRAKYVVANKGYYKSMAETERVWEATDEGQIEIQIHHQIKALEILLEALATLWFLQQNEAKNIY